MASNLLIALIALLAIGLSELGQTQAQRPPVRRYVRAASDSKPDDKHHGHGHGHGDHKSMMHTHLSRKVFERACAASHDTIEEIIGCVTSSEALSKAIDPKMAAECYKEAFGVDFETKDLKKQKDLICKDRDKFETMTACVYRTAAEALDKKELEKLTEAMVDVGLCIINALDS